MEFLENGTKKAAVTVNAFWKKYRHLMSDDEAHALKILIAAAAKNPDQQPETWHCDVYCRKVRHVSCEGELCAEECSPASCPYLDEMLY